MNATMPDSIEFERMKENLLTAASLSDQRRTRRHRIAAIGIAATMVAGTTAGAIVIARAPQGQINYVADCYAAADINSQHGTSAYLPGDENSKTATPLDQRVKLAEDMCAATWQVGTFGSTSVPNLVTCQLPDGRLAVFPSNDSQSKLCEQLSLETPH